MSERRSLLQESLAAIERLQGRLDAVERARHEPIAIIGAGCRYPGGIETVEALWRVVRDGIDTVSEVPRDRWDIDAYYDPDPQASGKMSTRRGGFLSQVDRFDAPFFGISPREAATLDPQQRLLLETASEAFESAGIAADRLAGSLTGVFVGITTSDYGQLMRLGGPEHSDVYSATGSALNAAAGRVAFTFGLQGPCVAVDTACSSSLVAVHLACQSLRTRESNLALAGGVNVILSPDAMVLFSKWGMMAPDGACKTFAAAADGFVRAEGCAVIALKRLSDAVSDGDPILAVIRGSAVNSDGRSSGLTVPNGPAQEAVLRAALASAQLKPADIDYVEAHGTGTSLGDPIEAEALGAVMRQGRARDQPLLIGSIKTNLGHTEAASGLAGLLKVVMALRHQAIPASLHFLRPNPRIPWAALPIEVPTTLTPWPEGARIRRAGVSSFGFSGTNAHVVLEESPRRCAEVAPVDEKPLLLPLSARDEGALKELALRYADALAISPAADVAFTASTGRVHLSKRMALLVDSADGAADDLRAFAAGRPGPSITEGVVRAGERPKIAFLFTGQGSQYAGMGRSLYAAGGVFREVMDVAAAVLAPRLRRPLLEVIFDDGAMLAETAHTQPALFAMEYALAQLWRSWGINPSIVLGHSVGEYTAACVAGVFSFEAGLELVAERGRLMQSLPAGGSMAAMFADESIAAALVSRFPGQLAIAAVNGPEETVISGDTDAVSSMLRLAAADGIKSRLLEVSHAFHSPLLDPMLDSLERSAGAATAHAPRIQLISNLTGAPFPADVGPDARYWRRQAREPVRFAACIDSLKAAGVNALVEVGPHPTLLGLIARAAPSAHWLMAASLRRGRDERREMLSSLGALYVRGAAVKWDALKSSGARRIALPTYPFQRQRHWVDERPAQRPSDDARGVHPLLGSKSELADRPGTFLWQSTLDLERHPWLRDHRVEGAIIVPATAYIEMALAAGTEILGVGSLCVGDIKNLKPIVLQENQSRQLQSTLVVEPGGTAQFSVYSRSSAPEGAAKPTAWIKHVTASVIRGSVTRSTSVGLTQLQAARERCEGVLSGDAFYAELARKGSHWGPYFQGVEELRLGAGEVIGRVRIAGYLREQLARYLFHPALADACGHPLMAAISRAEGSSVAGGAMVGGGVGQFHFHASPTEAPLWVHAKQRPDAHIGARDAIWDLNVHDDTGALLSETLDARLWYPDVSDDNSLPEVPEDWYYQPKWQQRLETGASLRAAESGPWLVFADNAGVGVEIAAQRRGAGLDTVLVRAGDRASRDENCVTIRPDRAEDYRNLLESVGRLGAVVHLWSTDQVGVDDSDPLGAALAAGPESILHVLQALRPGSGRPRLWLASAGAQSVIQADSCDAPWGAALWGLGRTLSVEHAEYWGGLVDLEIGADVRTTAAGLIREIHAGGVEDKIAFRQNLVHAARLQPLAVARDHAPAFSARADGTYLVSGGLGGVGFEMAQWLAQRGARHLLLLGRTSLPPRADWAQLPANSRFSRQMDGIAALEKSGVRVETAALDIVVAGALESCLEARRMRGEPEVCGVMHAAGVLQLEALAGQSVASMRAGLAAKMSGAWRLHEMFAGAALDCFVLCSSSSALLSSPLLGGYAAGNAFLDALAAHRRARGMAALSINWGTWGEVGMAAQAGRQGGDMLNGMTTISTVRGLAALGELLDAAPGQAAVLPIDWTTLARSYPSLAADPFLQILVAKHAAAASGLSASRLSLAALRMADSCARPGLVTDYLRVEAARVLGMQEQSLDVSEPLSGYGLDSLMAVQLKNRIESDLRVLVPMIRFLQGPSVEQLTSLVLAEAAVHGAEAAWSEPVTVEEWEEGSL